SWRAGEQCMVSGRSVRPIGREPDDLTVFHQLQPEKRLVYLVGSNRHCELASQRRKCMDRAGGRWSGSRVQDGTPASQSLRTVVRQRCTPGRWFFMGTEDATGALIPESACEEELESPTKQSSKPGGEIVLPDF